MNDSPDNQLNNLLRSWSTSETDQLSNEDLLISQITNRLVPTSAPKTSSGRNATVGVVLACLSVCVAFCVFLLPFGTSGSSGTDLASLRALAVPNQADVERQTLVLDEFQRLFGNRFRWATEEHGDVNLQVENPESTNDAHDKPSQAVLVRLVMQRDGMATAPNVIEVLTHSEQTIHLDYGPGKSSSLEIWTYVLPDGMVMVTTSVADSAMQQTTDSLQPAGEATVVAADSDDQSTANWQIVQSVTLIGERLL